MPVCFLFIISNYTAIDFFYNTKIREALYICVYITIFLFDIQLLCHHFLSTTNYNYLLETLVLESVFTAATLIPTVPVAIFDAPAVDECIFVRSPVYASYHIKRISQKPITAKKYVAFILARCSDLTIDAFRERTIKNAIDRPVYISVG